MVSGGVVSIRRAPYARVPAAEVDAMRILILDDDPSRTALLADAAARGCPGADVRRVPMEQRTVEQAVGLESAGLVVLGPGAADGPGAAALLRVLAAREPDVPVLLVSACDAAAPAVAAVRAGAADYVALRDGEGMAEVTAAVARLAVHDERGPRRAALAAGRQAGAALAGLVGRSPGIEQVRELVRTAARTEAHVLIEGETGTGKEVVARALHALGRRAAGPFVPVNCAAIPETLAESEFSGQRP